MIPSTHKQIKDTDMDATGDPGWMKDYWKDQDVFILGSGASLTDFDLNRLNGKNVIACAHMVNFFPAQFCVFLDVSVLHGLNKSPGPWGRFHSIVSQGVSGKSYGHRPGRYVTSISTKAKHAQRKGVQLDPHGAIYSGFSSGYVATNIALIMGAKKIYLLGHDCCAVNGKTHCYDVMKVKGEVPSSVTSEYADFKHGWKAFDKWKHMIYNLSAPSQIETFDKMDVNKVI